MLLVADVHGADAALRRVAGLGEPLLVLGDLINLIDYRSLDGIVAEVSGTAHVAEMVRLRTRGEVEAARRVWARHAAGREEELRARYRAAIVAAYRTVCAALTGSRAIVTYGNADRPDLLRRHLPPGVEFVDTAVRDIEGRRVGIAGGGVIGLGTVGEVTDEEMEAKLATLGPVDILCTHVPPLVEPLARDVVGGGVKGSRPVLDYVLHHRPAFHYFGDVHQPKATQWRVGDTLCRNVGYFRATGRAIRHE